MVNPKAFFLRQQALKAKLEPLAITKKKKKKTQWFNHANNFK
jgi:hypothetical protein